MSGVYIGVDGKARKVKGAYIGVDGKARKIKKGYIGVNGVARLCWSDVDPVFANNTWEEIALACQTGNVPDSWAVGDQKKMTINGTAYTVDIIGKNHDEYSDGSGKAPLTFQLHYCYGTMYQMNNSKTNYGGWENSVMRNTHLPTILELMPAEVKREIKEVNKLTAIGSGGDTLVTTSDKLFILSEIEVFGTSSYSKSIEGEKYSYYTDTSDRKKSYYGEASGWWLRSPYYDNAGTDFCMVSTAGLLGATWANNTQRISFAFCF